MPIFRIIAFDGGGIRGALSTRLLQRIVQKFPTLLNQTHMFAGTSTGSIIALGLAYNRPIAEIDDFYSYDKTKYIFSPKRPNWFVPKYRNIHLLESLESVFPKNLSLASLPKYVFVPAFNVKGYTCKGFQGVFFTNLINNPTISEKVIDVALSSSAAPTYFPSVNNFIDGGVFMNSPTAAPIIYVRSVFPNTYSLSDFRLLSIGTGSYPERIVRRTKNWGVFQWAFNPFTESKAPFLSVLLNTSTPIENRYSYELLKSNYYRLNPPLEQFIELDDYKKVPYLKQFADEVDLTEVFHYIER
ncbi:MAG: patatin-like phospholipase family protein, partial [Niameybacter sp.]